MMRRTLMAGLLAAAACLHADAWMRYDTGARPPLSYETLGGYRLFFHPDERDPLRRSLVFAVPVGQKLKRAYLLIRPYAPGAPSDKAWLRVEGFREFDYVRFDWDGTYGRDEFPDGLYQVDVRVTLTDQDEKAFSAIIDKGGDYPRFVKAAGASIPERKMLLSPRGEFCPRQEDLAVSRALTPTVTLVGQVRLPDMRGDFSLAGALVQVRRVQAVDSKGFPKAGAWECLSRAELPADSPARLKAKKVAFSWDISALAPGLYDLRLGVWHGLKVNATRDECDVPVLDYDVIRVRVAE